MMPAETITEENGFAPSIARRIVKSGAFRVRLAAVGRCGARMKRV